nr:TSUP family transporter [Oscillospiraceae bacterium]
MAMSILAGTVLGFLTGLGIGGGSLLILYLTLAVNMTQATARGINLLFFLPSALIACCFRWKQGTLHLRTVFPAMAAGCIAAAVFSWMGMRMDTQLLRRLFGGLLIATGLRELLYKPRP